MSMSVNKADKHEKIKKADKAEKAKKAGKVHESWKKVEKVKKFKKIEKFESSIGQDASTMSLYSKTYCRIMQTNKCNSTAWVHSKW